jgi:hypothetical protein
MKQNSRSWLRRAFKDECGQVIPILALMLTSFLGMTAIVVDVGDVYYSYNELLISTNAAALAGAQGLPFNTSTTNQASLNATQYSSQSGKLNAYGNLNITNVAVNLGCVTAGPGGSIPCVSTGTGTNTANAVQVVQTAKVPLYFAALFGTSSVTLTATSSALMKGAGPTPYNVAIIVDTTDSMSSNTDSNCGGLTRLNCALEGVRTLMQGLSPCAASSTGCGSATSGVVANPVDRVALFSFPNMLTTTSPQDYNCTNSNPTAEVYTYPTVGASSYTPVAFPGASKNQTASYQVTMPASQVTGGVGDTNGFVSDYMTSDGSASLNSSSDVVEAANGKSGCTGIVGPSGEGTYYAGVIYAAQAALTAEASLYPGTQNVLILISDGEATSCYVNGSTVGPGCTNGKQSTNQMSSTGVNNAGSINSNGPYPSYVNECAQAVAAAQYASNHGTTVYSVAYGSEATGCTTDTGTYTSPCLTMQNIASSSATFYSDYNQSGSTNDPNCTAGKSVSSLNDIFVQIASNLTVARLIPNTIFPTS